MLFQIGQINAGEKYPIENYLDVNTINFLKDIKEVHPDKNHEVHARGKAGIQLNARDHARIPMIWDASPQAGFTDGKPWMVIPEKIREVNVQAQTGEPDSVLTFYKKLLTFRKTHADVFVYGSSELLDQENEDTVSFWKRDGKKEALVILNFSNKRIPYEVPSGLELEMSNYKESEAATLEAYEGRIYLKKQ